MTATNSEFKVPRFYRPWFCLGLTLCMLVFTPLGVFPALSIAGWLVIFVASALGGSAIDVSDWVMWFLVTHVGEFLIVWFLAYRSLLSSRRFVAGRTIYSNISGRTLFIAESGVELVRFDLATPGLKVRHLAGAVIVVLDRRVL